MSTNFSSQIFPALGGRSAPAVRGTKALLKPVNSLRGFAGEIVRADAGIVVNFHEREAVLADQRQIARDTIIVKYHSVHRACNAAIVSVSDLGGCEEKRRARLKRPRHAGKYGGLITAWEVKHHAPRNRRVEDAVCERTLASVGAHNGCTRQVDSETGKHSGGAVQTNDAMASVHESLGNWHAVA